MDEEARREWWEGEVRRSLRRLSGRLTEALRPVAGARQPPGTHLVQFEAHIEDLDCDFSVLYEPFGADEERPATGRTC